MGSSAKAHDGGRGSRSLRLGAATVLAACVALVAWTLGASVVGAATQDVSIAGFAFSPAQLTVGNGVSVIWTNADGVTHTVTADDGSFDSGPIGTGTTFNHTFTAAGSIAYHCKIHPTMTGTIVVQAATSPPTSTVPTTPSRDPSPLVPLVALLAGVVGLLVVRRRLLES